MPHVRCGRNLMSITRPSKSIKPGCRRRACDTGDARHRRNIKPPIFWPFHASVTGGFLLKSSAFQGFLASRRCRFGVLRVKHRTAPLFPIESGSGKCWRVSGPLAAEKKRYLVCLDGFDDLLGGGVFTKALWDNLRNLGELGSLKYLTGSR
jgi:hypothetical protein